MKNPVKMTRDEMQTEAMIVENLLDAAMALFAGGSTSESMDLIGMAGTRAARLNEALDIVNEVAA